MGDRSACQACGDETDQNDLVSLLTLGWTLVSSRHVESHVAQNNRVTPARITELFQGRETWPTACLLVILKHLIWDHIFFNDSHTKWIRYEKKVPDCLSRNRLQPVRQPNLTQTTHKHEENLLSLSVSHRPLSWHTECMCFQTDDAIYFSWKMVKVSNGLPTVFVCDPPPVWSQALLW